MHRSSDWYDQMAFEQLREAQRATSPLDRLRHEQMAHDFAVQARRAEGLLLPDEPPFLLTSAED